MDDLPSSFHQLTAHQFKTLLDGLATPHYGTGHVYHFTTLALGLIGRALENHPFSTKDLENPDISHAVLYEYCVDRMALQVFDPWKGQAFPADVKTHPSGLIWAKTKPTGTSVDGSTFPPADGSPFSFNKGKGGTGDRNARKAFMKGLSDLPAYQDIIQVGTNWVSSFPQLNVSNIETCL